MFNLKQYKKGGKTKQNKQQSINTKLNQTKSNRNKKIVVKTKKIKTFTFFTQALCPPLHAISF